MKEKYSTYLNNKFNAPRTRIEINALCRYLVSTNPIYHETINFYSTFLPKYLDTIYSTNDNKTFYEEQNQQVDLTKKLSLIIRELLIYGEAFPYCELSEMAGNNHYCFWKVFKWFLFV